VRAKKRVGGERGQASAKKGTDEGRDKQRKNRRDKQSNATWLFPTFCVSLSLYVLYRIHGSIEYVFYTSLCLCVCVCMHERA
jgi:hypothetical protein